MPNSKNLNEKIDYGSDQYKVELGKRLNSMLKQTNTSQAKLAEQLGTSAPYISRIISGKSLPGTEILLKIGQIFNVDLNWFLNGSRYYEDLHIVEDVFIGIVFHVIVAKSISEGALDAQAYATAMLGNDFEKILEEYSPHILINSKLSEDMREKQICGSLVFDFIENIKLPSLAAELYNKYSYISDDKERNRLAG